MRLFTTIVSGIIYILFPALAISSVNCEDAEALVKKANKIFLSDPLNAEELYIKAVVLCPESANAHYNLGLARYGRQNFQGAASSFEMALSLNHDFVEAMNGLARAYISLGIKLDEAKELIEKALKIVPRDEVLNATLAAIKERGSLAAEEATEPVRSSGIKHILAEKVHTIPDINIKKRKNAYAVVIGIEVYRDITGVEYATNDARWFREYLIKLAGVPEENIISLYNERASKGDISKYIENWLKNNVTEGDASVYIYYAGHGAPDINTKKAYIIPYDGDPVYLERTAYALEDLYASLNKLPAKEIVVALDSCFSGAGGRSVIAKGTRPVVVSIENPLLSGGKTIVLAASKGSQVSSFYPEAGHGLFTYYLLLGLKGEADADKNGWVDIKELYEYITPNVAKIARRMNREQVPTLLPSQEVIEGEKLKIKLTKTKKD